MAGHAALPGRLGLSFYIVIAEPTARAGERGAATDAHLAWLAGLEAEGRLFLAGPFTGEDGASTGGGLFILRAASQAEAEALAAADPYNALGYRTATVRRWRLDQGAFNLSVSLTRSGADFR